MREIKISGNKSNRFRSFKYKYKVKIKRKWVTIFTIVALCIVLLLKIKGSSIPNISNYLSKSMENQIEPLINNGENKSYIYDSKHLQNYQEKNIGKMYEENVYKKGKHFRIYNLTKNYKQKFIYKILNNLGQAVKNKTVENEPYIVYETNSLLSIEIRAGTGLWLTEYYDVEQDLFSVTYQSPLKVHNNLVVYVEYFKDELILVVKDIFDKDKCYKEFALDFAPVANPIDACLDIQFLSDSEFTFSYLSGKNYDEKTVALRLN